MKNIFFALIFMALGFGCAKSKDAPVLTHQYGLLGGGCYDYTTSAYVAASNCSATSTTGYTLTNGLCHNSAGQQVEPAFCTQTATGYYNSNGQCFSSANSQPVALTYCNNGTMNPGGQCIGSYIYNNFGNSQWVYCAGANCRGYTLIQVSTGQSVYCQ